MLPLLRRIGRAGSALFDRRTSGLVSFPCALELSVRKLAVDPIGLHHCAYRLILGRHVSASRLYAISLPTVLLSNQLPPNEPDHSLVIVDGVLVSFI